MKYEVWAKSFGAEMFYIAVYYTKFIFTRKITFFVCFLMDNRKKKFGLISKILLEKNATDH